MGKPFSTTPELGARAEERGPNLQKDFFGASGRIIKWAAPRPKIRDHWDPGTVVRIVATMDLQLLDELGMVLTPHDADGPPPAELPHPVRIGRLVKNKDGTFSRCGDCLWVEACDLSGPLPVEKITL